LEKLHNFEQLTQYMPKNEVYYNINISLKNRYIYCETAKSACTTIKRTLMNAELSGTGYRPKRVHLDAFSTPFIKLFQLDFNKVIKLFRSPDYFKFGFVRNPYLRILSAYLDKIVGNKPQKLKILKTMGKNENDLDVEIRFSDFLDVIENQSPYEMDQHWRPQYYQLFGDVIKYDFIGRVESLKDDFKKIENLSGIKIMEHYEDVFWHKTDSQNKIFTYYNSHEAKKILKIYACDFENYAYSSNLKAATKLL
jgi:hypothetical protein